MTETIENGVYTCKDGDRVLLTITELGNNTYRAVNMSFVITAEVEPIDDYTTRLTCLEHKRRGKDGIYRSTTKLMEHNLRWLDWILEEKGFIRRRYKNLDGGLH